VRNARKTYVHLIFVLDWKWKTIWQLLLRQTDGRSQIRQEVSKEGRKERKVVSLLKTEMTVAAAAARTE
jgi:hypothetical protein